jgi:type I restriction enzyme, S subunit
MKVLSNWKEVYLESHIDLLSGFAFKSKYFTDNPEDIPLVKCANLHQGYIDGENAKRWNIAEYEKHKKFQLKLGDVLVAMDRPWIEAGLKFAWIGESDPKSLLVQRVARLRGKNGLLTEYIRYLIGSPSFTDYIKPIVTGINVPHISGKQIKEFQFSLPPLPTQNKIASILSAYDRLIENNTRRIKILESMAQTLYQEWFVKFRFPGCDRVKMVESELGLIPEAWEVIKITDAVLVNPRTQVSKQGEKPFVPMGSLSTDSMLINDIESRTGNSGAKFKNYDTLLARITPSLENGKTGYVQFLSSDDSIACGSTEFVVLRSNTLCSEYVYLLARSDNFRENAIKSMTGSSGRQRVQVGCFETFLIAHPDSNTIQKFSEIVSPLFRQIYVLSEKNDNLRKTRDLLLPKLISGQIDVENLDIDTGELAA